MIRDLDFADWCVDAWICDGNAVLRQVDVATREEHLPQQNADLSIDLEMLVNHDGRLSRQEGDLVPEGSHFANGDSTALPQGHHLVPREDHLAFDLHDVSFHRNVPSSQPMAAKKEGGTQCQPDASRQDRKELGLLRVTYSVTGAVAEDWPFFLSAKRSFM